MASQDISRYIHNNSGLALDFCVSVFFVLILCFFFEPQWKTNDDLAMSMVAHGYGIAAEGTPNLVFSNVIWGHLVRAIPQINGVWGYSIATIGVLVIVGAVILHALRKIFSEWTLPLAVIVLLLTRPVLFPQFTINAGLLTLGAVVCWHFYGRSEYKGIWILVIGHFLAFFGYLVRSQEFLLILLIASPLLPWRKLSKDRAGQAATIAFLLAMAGAYFIDQKAYKTHDWHFYNASNTARVPFTDFGADFELLQRPEIASNHGYTPNDIKLLSTWFFVDKNILDPDKLNSMLRELGPLRDKNNVINDAWISIKTSFHPVLAPIFLCALFLLLLNPNRKLFTIWILAIAAILSLGSLGRPGILRVYIPVASLLLITPLIIQNSILASQGTLRARLVQCALMISLFFNIILVFSESRDKYQISEQIRADLRGFPTEPIVVWGGVFPFERVYSVLRQFNPSLSYKFYALGAFTHAPSTIAYTEQALGRGMIERLTTQGGIPIIATEQRFELLKVYCKERLDGMLHEVAQKEYGRVHVSWRHCATKNTHK